MTPSPKLQCAAAYQQIVAASLGKQATTEPLLPAVWPLAKANHLLLAVWRGQGCPEDLDAAWTEQVNKAAQFEAETAVAVQEIIPQFTAVDLPLFAIKSFLPFPYADSNLDIVTAKPERQAEYKALLRELGYRPFRNLADLREPMKQTYQKDGVRLRLHLHTAVSWNGVVYLPLGQVWQRRRLWPTADQSVWIPSAEDELLIMAAHAWFENKLVSLHEILYWRELVQTDLDWAYLTKTAQEAGWSKGFMQFMGIVSQLASLLGIPTTIPLPLPTVPLSDSIWLPYVFPVRQNWPVTSQKMAADWRRGEWHKLPRQLFSYLLVDHFWMYRKAYRKWREVTAVSCS
ncbi:MAG: nucleotidyltransferase family protein [Ardenticatenaceae bacterium]|nr:nucleotidyltransferase family protein [Ardenticatenaceae bacterium]